MDDELAQIQGGCVNGPSNFGNAALGFEISMDSFASADNHVSAARSVECTRVAYGKGAAPPRTSSSPRRRNERTD